MNEDSGPPGASTHFRGYRLPLDVHTLLAGPRSGDHVSVLHEQWAEATQAEIDELTIVLGHVPQSYEVFIREVLPA